MIMPANPAPALLMRGAGFRRRSRFRGLGDYVSDCTGPNPNCGPLDSLCIANWTNIVNACETKWITDPNSAYRNPSGSNTTTQLTTSSPDYTTWLAAAGGSTQLAQQAVGESVPPGTSATAWWGAPGANVAGKGSTVAQGAAAPAVVPTSVTPPPAATTTTTTAPTSQLSQLYGQLYGTPVQPISTTTTTTSYLPLLLIGGGVIVLITLLAKR